MGRESKFHNPNYYWEGKSIVTLDQWFQIKEKYSLKAALQYFPNDFPRFGFPFHLDGIEDQILKLEADQWRSDFLKLMEYGKNAEYGKTKCFRCLISTDREEAAIFIGINKVISRFLDTDGVSIYPCKILNRFACPYDNNMIVGGEEEEEITVDSTTKKPDVNYLFIYLSLLLQLSWPWLKHKRRILFSG